MDGRTDGGGSREARTGSGLGPGRLPAAPSGTAAPHQPRGKARGSPTTAAAGRGPAARCVVVPPLPNLPSARPHPRIGRSPPPPPPSLRDGVRQRRGSPVPALPTTPPSAHLEMLLEANGQYLGHGWGGREGRGGRGRAPRGRGRRWQQGRRCCTPHGGREEGRGRRRRRSALTGMAPQRVRLPFLPQLGAAHSGARITPHLTSLPGSPQIVPPAELLPPPHSPRLSLALTPPRRPPRPSRSR